MAKILIVSLSLLGLTVCSSAAHDPPPQPEDCSEAANECACLAGSYNKHLDSALIEGLKVETGRSLSKRPGMTIEDVLWVGQGEYQILCGGRYPASQPVTPSTLPTPEEDMRHIDGWSRGGRTAEKPGTYTFPTDERKWTIKEYEATEENLALFGAKLTHGGAGATRGGFFTESVLAVYDYKDNYFSDWVMRPGPLGGSRIERHPVDHMFTLIKPSEKNGKSYFILGKVEDEKLELGAIRLEVGVTILVPANTVHTNDYVKGTLEEIYPRIWGIDEVLLTNREGKRVELVPKE